MPHLHDEKIKELEEKAQAIRASIIKALIEAKSGHTAGPLGMTDIFTLLYFHVLKHDPKNPEWEERDRLVLSNGHICPVLYATMAHAGYFSVEEFETTLRKFGTKFQGHPHREFLPALETSSGPLGSGLSQALGMALAERINKGRTSSKFFYCLTGDGELNEGQAWEAFMHAGKEKLHNLITIIDRNNIQIDGYTEDIMPLESLREKLESFNWHVIEVGGHDFTEVHSAIEEGKAVFDKPTAIIAYTVPGKGIEWMENRPGWHGNPPGKGPEDVYEKDEQGQEALKALRTLDGKITSEHE